MIFELFNLHTGSFRCM